MLDDKPQDTTRAKERVEKLRKTIARAITSISHANDLFQHECKFHKWDEDLAFEIAETIGDLGVHLANLDLWFDEVEQ